MEHSKGQQTSEVSGNVQTGNEQSPEKADSEPIKLSKAFGAHRMAGAQRRNLVQLAARFYGNRQIQRLITHLTVQRAQEGWELRSGKATTGVNASETSVQVDPSDPSKGSSRRIPLGGLTIGVQTDDAYDDTNVGIREPGEDLSKPPTKFHKAKEYTNETSKGEAIVVIPDNLDVNKPVEVLLHLHGYNIGYRVPTGGKKTRDEGIDRIEQQLRASNRNMIGILPQGRFKSGFENVDRTAYIQEIFNVLNDKDLWKRGSKTQVNSPGPIALSAHSGGSATLAAMLGQDVAAANKAKAAGGQVNVNPAGMEGVFLFDAINGTSDSTNVNSWLDMQFKNDLQILQTKKTEQEQLDYLAHSMRFLGIHTAGHYTTQYQPVVDNLKKLYKSADSLVPAKFSQKMADKLKDNYKTVPAGDKPDIDHKTGQQKVDKKGQPMTNPIVHDEIMGQQDNNNLKKALDSLPQPAPAPAPTPVTPNPGSTPPTPASSSSGGTGSPVSSGSSSFDAGVPGAGVPNVEDESGVNDDYGGTLPPGGVDRLIDKTSPDRVNTASPVARLFLPGAPSMSTRVQRKVEPAPADDPHSLDSGVEGFITDLGFMRRYPTDAANSHENQSNRPRFLIKPTTATETFDSVKIHPAVKDPLTALMDALHNEGKKLDDASMLQAKVASGFRTVEQDGSLFLNALKKTLAQNKETFGDLTFPSALEATARSNLSDTNQMKTFITALANSEGWNADLANKLVAKTRAVKAPAGSSTHHSGVVVDIDFPFINGNGKKVTVLFHNTDRNRNTGALRSAAGVWLSKNAASFGFDTYSTGLEIWHQEWLKWSGSDAEKDKM